MIGYAVEDGCTCHGIGWYAHHYLIDPASGVLGLASLELFLLVLFGLTTLWVVVSLYKIRHP